ncbi:MAG: nuclear transport factor 2 family protein [Sphingobacterium sp.]|jgi:3-phenylpropionate/cinnamic acid dioxygenase small subunit|nr:nuclear transport factor 2 family protein [Sphingobacterium sp.]
MESILQNLIEERAISNQLSRLARIVDERNWDKLGDIYSEDVTFQYPGEDERKGLNTLRQALEAYLNNCGPTQHMLSGDLITNIHNNKAESSVYAQAVHQGKGNNAHLFYNAYGAYADQWEKIDSEWKIVNRKFLVFQTQGDIAAMGMNNSHADEVK